MQEFCGFYKSTKNRKYNTWCKYTTRLDTYGCGCVYDCKYCYAKGLLNFRGNWNQYVPKVAYITEIIKKIECIDGGSVVRIGGMTDCFQPIEKKYGVTFHTIQALNYHKVHYLIVTKSDLVADEKYLKIYDNDLAHFQVTITATDDSVSSGYEKAPVTSKRIRAIEMLYYSGFDVSVRLSPYIESNIDLKVLGKIGCSKILVEFLKANHFTKKWFLTDYSKYTLNYGGYSNLQLDEKIRQIDRIQGFGQVSVGEYVKEHYEYFRENVNQNKEDCCNLEIDNSKDLRQCEQMRLEL